MAQKTKEELKSTLVNGHLVTGGDFTNLVDSLKGMQTAVSNPSASGNATAFIDSISQDAEGKITATKKNVSFSGYQTTAGMANYQQLDLQQVGEVTAAAGGSQTINHNMNHYPTVRILNTATNFEESDFRVKHDSVNALTITIGGSMGAGTYKYILD